MSLLTIFIPTYNRCNLLAESLSIIFDEWNSLESDLKSKIEIVISNNCSDDDTEEVVKKYQEICPIIKYNLNKFNLGAEENIELGVQFAKHKYLWILGDDDHIERGGLKLITNELIKDFPCIILNYSVWDAKMEKKTKSKKFNINKDLNLKQDNVMKVFGPHLGFISMLVIDIELLKLGFKECKNTPLITPGWPLLASVYCGLKHTTSCSKFLHKPILRNRSGNSHLPNWDESFVYGFWHIFSEHGGLKYPKSDLRAARAIVVKDFIFWRIIYQFFLTASDEKTLHFTELRVKFGDTAIFWVRAFPVLLIGRTWPVALAVKNLLPLYYYLKQKRKIR